MRRRADEVNYDRFVDPEGGEVVYQGKEVFRGRPHATEDTVKSFMWNVLADPDSPGHRAVWSGGEPDELTLGRMAAAYFQIQGAENPSHMLWDWVDEVIDDIYKRRFSATRRIAAERGLVPYGRRDLQRHNVEEVDVELNPDTWEVREHYWGIRAEDGEIVHVRLGNWSDAGWYWDGKGEALLAFLFRLARAGEDLMAEFMDAFPNPEFRRAIMRTFKKCVANKDYFDTVAYIATGDNAGWHFGGNDQELDSLVENQELEYLLDREEDYWWWRELKEVLLKLRGQTGLRISIEDIDTDELKEFISDHWYEHDKCRLDEKKVTTEFQEYMAELYDFSSPWKFMESVVDEDNVERVEEWMRETMQEKADECFYETMTSMNEELLAWIIETYGDEVRELPPPKDPRQLKLPLEARVKRGRR